jgi:hypothetical protein
MPTKTKEKVIGCKVVCFWRYLLLGSFAAGSKPFRFLQGEKLVGFCFEELNTFAVKLDVAVILYSFPFNFRSLRACLRPSLSNTFQKFRPI